MLEVLQTAISHLSMVLNGKRLAAPVNKVIPLHDFSSIVSESGFMLHEPAIVILAHRYESQRHKLPIETGQLDQTQFSRTCSSHSSMSVSTSMREKVGGAAASTLIGLPPVCVITVAVDVMAVAADNAGVVAAVTGVRARAGVVTVPAKVGLAAVLAVSQMARVAGEVGLSVSFRAVSVGSPPSRTI